MMYVGADAVVETLRLIERGEADAVPQQDELASPAPKIFRDDCRIDWTWPAERLHNFIRGLSPYPAAFTLVQGKVIKLYRASLTDETGLPPGEMHFG
jgi:methionyl-tRNA formyltransferase